MYKGVREHIQAAILKRDEIKDNNKLRSFEHRLLPVFFVLERNESKLYLLKDYQSHIHVYTVKPVLSGHSKRRPKFVFKTGYRLMQVQSIAECSKPWNILQYFRPSLSYHMSSISLFCLFLSDRLRQVLLYHYYVVVV